MPYGYGLWLQELLDNNSGLFLFAPSIVFCILDARELFRGKTSYTECLEELCNIQAVFSTTLQQHSEYLFFIANLDYPNEIAHVYKDTLWHRSVELEWNKMVQQLYSTFDNCYMFDIKSIIENCGRKTFYSAKMWYLGGCRFSLKGYNLVEKSICQITQSYEGKQKKCLLLDLDNTLWGGIIGEQGLHNIQLSEFKEGARYKDFQRVIKNLKDMGIILGIVSKNNEDDAMEVIRQHEHMVLQENDFVIRKINWDSKVENIKQVAAELNIGLDAIVFIDDNPVEREQIQQLIPEVSIPEFPHDTSLLAQFMMDVWQQYFLKLDITEEDRKKTVLYQQNSARHQAKSAIHNVEDFLYSLKTIITVWQATREDVERIAQLTQKTNQFNLTTKRYTADEIQAMLVSPHFEVWIGTVSDKFGDNGKTIVWIIHYSETDVELDTFLMSCRVMGRKIEEQVLGFIERYLGEQGIDQLQTFYFPTKKNIPVREFFINMGYKAVQVDDIGNTTYIMDLSCEDKRQEYARLIVQ